MSGPEHRHPDDRELEEFLAGQGPHHARYRAASSERPPPALDAQVLARARAALPPRRDRLRRWRLPLSLAATLVLGIGLVSRVQREAPPPAAESAVDAAAIHSPRTSSPEIAAEQEARALVRRDQAEQATNAKAGAERAPATGALQARKALAVERQKAEMLAQAPAVSATPAAGAAVADVLPAPLPPPAAAMAPESQAELAADAAPAVAAAPRLALQAPPSETAAKSQRRSAAVTAIAPVPEAAPRYLGDSGLVLELPPGRYRLLAANEAPLLAGERLPMAGGREQLLGLDGGEDGCRLWLEPLAAEPERLLLTGDCESGLKGEYRRLESGR